MISEFICVAEFELQTSCPATLPMQHSWVCSRRLHSRAARFVVVLAARPIPWSRRSSTRPVNAVFFTESNPKTSGAIVVLFTCTPPTAYKCTTDAGVPWQRTILLCKHMNGLPSINQFVTPTRSSPFLACAVTRFEI